MRKNLPAIIVILILSAAASLPLLVPGLHQIHDDQQIARLFLFNEALQAGQFPVRWVDGLGFGFGYPLFVFYPPLVYLVGEAFHILGATIVDSVKLVFAASILLSGIAMYIFAKSLWGKLPAVVASAFYILLPYRALDIYVRGALAESFSFVWLPLILWSFHKLINEGRLTHLLAASIFMALLMVTHNLIFLPFTLILTIYLPYLILSSKNIKRSVANSFLSVALACGLSAFFWVPAIMEKKFTIVDELLLINLANYNIHFVYPQQLWNWAWGFGGSAAGLEDGISFKIGKLHIILAAASLFLTTALLFANRLKEKTMPVFYFLLAFSAFMTTFYSKPIWDTLSPLQYLQFPWRFLTFTGLFASILAGYFIYQLKLPILRLSLSVVLVAALILTNLKLFRPQAYRFDLTDETATSKEAISWDVSHSSFEYVPKGVPIKRGELGTNLIDIEKSQIPQEKIASNQDVKIESLETSPHSLNFSSQAEQSSIITANVFNFPGWTAKIDGKDTNILDNNRYKLISVNIPKGSHSVTIEFKDTKTRRVANLITLGSLAALLALIAKKQWQKKRSWE